MTPYKRAKEWLENNKRTSSTSRLSCALIPEKGVIKEDRNAICFAPLMRDSSTLIAYFVTASLPGQKLTPLKKRYLEWLANKSPLARAFKTKSAKIMKDRGTIFYTKDSPQYVIMAAVAARYVQEFPHIPEMWDKLRKHISKEDAFVLAHFLYEGSSSLSVGTRGNINHHAFISENFGKNEFNAFRSHTEFEHKENGTLRTHRKYSGITANFRKTELPLVESQFSSETSPVRSWTTIPLKRPIGSRGAPDKWGNVSTTLSWDNANEWAPKWVEENT